MDPANGLIHSKLLTLTINGSKVCIEVPLRRTLCDLLRDNLSLTGTKRGCNLGTCGSCTVLMDGYTIYSCMTLAVQAEGHAIITIEGLINDGQPHPIVSSFAALYAAQCGYCTPGIIMASKALLDSNPSPTPQEVREALAGTLCRCTGYTKIVEAVLAIARNREGNHAPSP